MNVRVLSAALALGLTLAGCSDPPPKTKAEDKDAGAAAPVMDKNIANAVASAAGSSGPAAGNAEGPPQSGVFDEGAADRAVPIGKTPEVTIAQKGSDPKIKLTPLFPLTAPVVFEVTVLRVEGKSSMTHPPVTFSVMAAPAGAEPAEEAEPKAPTKGAPAPKKDAPAPAAESAAPKESEAPPPRAPMTAAQPIVFVVTGVKPAAQKEVPIDEEDLKALETLKGSRIFAELSPSGLLGKETFEIPPTSDKKMGTVVRSLVETLGFMFSAVPNEPVGVGGQWIVGDRVSFAGMNLVRYRASTLEQAGDELVISIDVRLYAVDKNEAPIRFGEQAVSLAFQAQGNQQIVLKAGDPVPARAQLELTLGAQVAQSADAEMAQLFQMQAVGVLQPPGAPTGEEAKPQPKKGQ
jgi:hypothetical protein